MDRRRALTLLASTVATGIVAAITWRLRLLNPHSKLPPSSDRMPVLFLGHGSPMNAISENDFTKTLQQLGQNLPRPPAILAISAHWMTEGTWVTHMAQPKTIHDFGGFPQELFNVEYPAPGLPELAEQLHSQISKPEIFADDEKWGLDHGTWSVLRHLYPKADIPVIQLSLDLTKPAEFHFALGEQLRSLRDQGVLIVGSGNLVHNLQKINWDEKALPFPWALEFDEWAKEKINSRDFKALVQDATGSEAGRLSIPTPDHYYPLLYVLGASDTKDELQYIYEGFQNSSISMRCIGFGNMTTKRQWLPYQSAQLKGLSSFTGSKDSLLVLLHGLGSNESDLPRVGEQLSPSGNILSLRAPIPMQADSHAWYNIQFTPTGPIVNWPEAKASLELLENELKALSEQLKIPLNKIWVMGFSQGAIMTLGLALQGSLDLGGYVACSGRILPEFATAAKAKGPLSAARPLFISHGTKDDTLPIFHAHESRATIESLKGNLVYKEYDYNHGISSGMIADIREWLSQRR